MNGYDQLIAALKGQTLGAPLSVHIVGITGTEGAALASLLSQPMRRQPQRHQGGSLTLVGHDFSPALSESFEHSHVAVPAEERAARFAALMATPGLEIRSGEHYLAGIAAADVIFVGQNWRAYPANAPSLFDLEGRVPFAQMIDLYFELTPCPIVALTGTNGKTTSCNWIRTMAAEDPSGERLTRVSGNDLFSEQSLAELEELGPAGLLILEVSNRQARSLRRSAPIVGVTSLQPDHLSEHGSLEAYLAAKRRLVELQPRDSVTVLNADDAWVRSWSDYAQGRVLLASASPLRDGVEGAFEDSDGRLLMRLDGEETVLCQRSELSLPGPHNLTNSLVSALCARCAGVSWEGIRKGLRSFRGVRNRLQLVARVDGTAYYNDLASTTPWASIAALRSFEGTATHLIIGGGTKANEGYNMLAAELERRAKHVIMLPGAVSELVSQHLSDAVPRSLVDNIEQAVDVACAAAQPGDRVILSPAGAGFYTAFLGRAGSFNQTVRDRLRRNRVA